MKGGICKKRDKNTKCSSSMKNNDTQSSADTLNLHGFVNTGNTCYMSSALQCLLATQTLTTYFCKNFNKQKPKDKKTDSKETIAEVFAELVQRYQESSERILSLSRFKAYFSNQYPAFKGSYQHDAQEFIAVFLDIIHENLNKAPSKKCKQDPDINRKTITESSLKQLASQAWKRYLEGNESIIVDLFQGQLATRIMCLTCREFLLKFEPFMYLSLPVKLPQNSSQQKKNKSLTLELLLDAFQEPEKLLEPCWYCPKCQKKVYAEKCTRLINLPPILIIHYKLYEGTSQKLPSKVIAPLVGLSFKNYVHQKEEPIYDLYAVLDHAGEIDYGHYIAYCKYQSRWFRLDDTDIGNAKENEIINENNYVLFYERHGLSADSSILDRHAIEESGEKWYYTTFDSQSNEIEDVIKDVSLLSL